MKVGDLVKQINPWYHNGQEETHHGVVLQINKSCGDLAGHILVQWFGVFNDRVKAHHPSDVVLLEKNKKNT